jgi:DNA-binding NarL/FixJ family response regulator
MVPGLRVIDGGSPIRVIIVENHQLVSESLGLLLDAQKDMLVVRKATSVAEAAALPRNLAPHVVVMDFHLDDGTGRDAAVAMREIYPSVRFVFLSRDDSDDARLAAVEAGASLSQRELEVLQLLSDGVQTRQIAQRLGISYSTVRSHLRSISAKLGARSMVNAVVTARELELVS